MTAPYPFGFIGDGVTRCVLLALPTWKVRGFLPAGLELGKQDVTPEGTHPVIFLFHEFVHCQFSFPTFLPPMKFHEQTVGVPFTCVQTSSRIPNGSGPYYFMPKLYLDDAWVWMIGKFYWGFDKKMASVRVTPDSYTVASSSGELLASLEWSGSEGVGRLAVEGCREFEPIRNMLTQPLISFSTMAPFLSLTDFDRTWNLASVRTIYPLLEVSGSYLPGFDGGFYETIGAPGSLLGAYELSAPWWLSFPYLP